ncbi:YgjP-like metallopeptidase domain-containing protein [Dechloromonas hortensis]|uniref:YgjP-like metallopeptidase domain-containing protein n=1 Tax=Dechloromonas hortensis TaxID=337779 RepID=UPI001291DC2F|nr:YgjP-like metallopeptidase domain-containing protein [Dechloromonas hortensis]
MRPKPPPDYLANYPSSLTEPVWRLIKEKRLGEVLLRKYPLAHEVRSDKALYDYVQAFKNQHMRNAPQPSKVGFDAKLRDLRQALGTHTSIARVQGGKLKSKREIHVAALFREMPEAFLRMIVVHELAHLKEREHDKAFYQLCCHMAADYHQLEFDLRVYLTHLAAGGEALWSTAAVDLPQNPKTER